MTNETKATLSGIILECDAEDLRQVRQLIKFRQGMLEEETKAKLKVGDTVQVHGSKVNEMGIVRDVKRTKAVVEIDGKQWNCPMSMLTIKDKL